MQILNIVIGVIALFFSIAGVNFALVSWIRSDMRQFESEIRSWKEEINKEIKDFHGRMCALEEKKKTGS